MKKKLNFLKNIALMILSTAFLCGCSTLSYSGEDFNKNNVKSITTNEMFYFSTYQKNLTNEGVDVRVGVSKTQLMDVLVIYFEVDNLNNKEYYINAEDITITAASKPASIITSSNYVSSYQSEQNTLYASAQSLAPTVNNIANIANNYQNNNQNLMVREQNSAEASMRQINTLVSGIRAHAMQQVSSVKPLEKKYYYIFLPDGEYPIGIEYKGLNYTFNQNKK